MSAAAGDIPPSVVAYLDQLPHGLSSHPGSQSKNSVLRAWLEGHDVERVAAAVPSSLRPLARGEAALTQWIPEVHSNVIFLTVRELFFDSDEAFVEDAYRRNTALFTGRLYRAVMRILSPQRIGKTSGLAWGHYHRGMTLSLDVEASPWVWTIDHAPNLMPELIARCQPTVAVAALEVNGQTNVRAWLESATDRQVVGRLDFDR